MSLRSEAPPSGAADEIRSIPRRRPSAALVVSFVSLFVSLGGAGYAAAGLPANSVGSAQLRRNSVGPRKISTGSVGARQVNPAQVQRRVTGPCTSGAIRSIALSGNVTCTPALPNEYGTSAAATPTTLGPGSTQVASESLPGGAGGTTYLVIGNVQYTAFGNGSGSQSADLDCTMQAGDSETAGEATAQLDANQPTQAGTIPLVAPVAVPGGSQTVAITCSDGAVSGAPAPSVTVNATINAIQTAGNDQGAAVRRRRPFH